MRTLKYMFFYRPKTTLCLIGIGIMYMIIAYFPNATP